MIKSELIRQIQSKKSFLCVGLDSDLDKIPSFLRDHKNPLLAFNKRIIDATKDYCVAYKPNIAFYESLGSKGWDILAETIDYIPDNIFTIADAKRGDIGNTSRMYAKAFFERLNFDAVTVAPYMGVDSVKPFLEFDNKWVILLGLTSNEGSHDFQRIKSEEGKFFYEHVLEKSQEWGNSENLMYVVGATRADALKHIRTIIPDHFLLVPGVGAQGGDLNAVARSGANKDCGLLVNSSRGIIYAGDGEDFDQVAGERAKELATAMSAYL